MITARNPLTPAMKGKAKENAEFSPVAWISFQNTCHVKIFTFDGVVMHLLCSHWCIVYVRTEAKSFFRTISMHLKLWFLDLWLLIKKTRLFFKPGKNIKIINQYYYEACRYKDCHGRWSIIHRVENHTAR